MEDLDKKWIWNSGIKCHGSNSDANFSKRLGLKNLEGIFVMVAGGILSGTVLIIVELVYDRCKKRTTGKEEDDEGSREEEGSTSTIQGTPECRRDDGNGGEDDDGADDSTNNTEEENDNVAEKGKVQRVSRWDAVLPVMNSTVKSTFLHHHFNQCIIKWRSSASCTLYSLSLFSFLLFCDVIKNWIFSK